MAVVAVALLAALGGLVWSYGLQNHLAEAEKKIAAADQKNAELTQQLEATNARLRATSETLGQSVGMTQKQIELRTQSIIASQRAAEAQAGAAAGGDAEADWRGVDRRCQREDGCGRREDGCCDDEVRPGGDEDAAEPRDGRCRA